MKKEIKPMPRSNPFSTSTSNYHRRDMYPKSRSPSSSSSSSHPFLTPDVRSLSLASESNDSDEALARRLQAEESGGLGIDVDTYVRILQDVEFSRAVASNELSRIRPQELTDQALLNLLQSPLAMRSTASRIHHHRRATIDLAREALDLSPEPIDMSYESLVELEDVSCGLPEQIIAGLPRCSYTASMEKNSCTVCLCDYEVGEEVTTLPCFHRFHYPCLSQWLSRKKVCPICKEEVV